MTMLKSDSLGSEKRQQLVWSSRLFFPNNDKDTLGQSRQVDSLLESGVNRIPGWEKAKD